MQGLFLQESLHKAPEFFLISWYENIAKDTFPQSFGRIARNYAGTAYFRKSTIPGK